MRRRLKVAGQEMGLTEEFPAAAVAAADADPGEELTAEMGYDLSKYKHVMPPIHNTLKRMKEVGQEKSGKGLAE